ncbi:MAG: DEAD/DEAH box helicase [Bacteroides sp.]|nr:DEAD/DEAH box helicase [Bacteroides sp.]
MQFKRIDKTAYGYEVTFPYDRAIVRAVKALHARWNGRTWFVTDDRKDKLEAFAQNFGFVMPEDQPMQVDEVEEIKPMRDLQVSIPLKQSLFPFQREGVQYLLDHPKCICGDKPGLGKTAQAIAAVVANNAFPCLVVCPTSLKYNWAEEIENKWTDKKALILSDSVKESWYFLQQCGMADFIIVNYESLGKYFVADIARNKDGKFKLKDIRFRKNISVFKSIVVDEAHRCKNLSTKQTKFVKGISVGKDYVYLLTGTPVVNRPDDLVPLLGILDKFGKDKRFGMYSSFKQLYCDRDDHWAVLNSKMRNDCYYCREKKDVLTQLPDKTRVVVGCDITTRKEYEDALADLGDYLRQYKSATDQEVRKSLRGEVIVRIGVLRNISARGKFATVSEYVTDLTESGEKIILFVNLREVVAQLKERFPDAVTIVGEDNDIQRAEAVRRFQNDPDVKVIICSIKAAGVGLTLTAAHTVGFVELPWHGADCEQCEDRAHRIGQKDAVNCIYFLGRDTIDEHIYEIILDKMRMSREITGERNEVETSTVDSIVDLLLMKKRHEDNER